MEGAMPGSVADTLHNGGLKGGESAANQTSGLVVPGSSANTNPDDPSVAEYKSSDPLVSKQGAPAAHEPDVMTQEERRAMQAESTYRYLFSRFNRAVDDFARGQALHPQDREAVEIVNKMIWGPMIGKTADNSSSEALIEASDMHAGLASVAATGTVLEEGRGDTEGAEAGGDGTPAVGTEAAGQEGENSHDNTTQTTAEELHGQHGDATAEAGALADDADEAPSRSDEFDGIPDGIFAVDTKEDSTLVLNIRNTVKGRQLFGTFHPDHRLELDGYSMMGEDGAAQVFAHIVDTTAVSQRSGRRGFLRASLLPRTLRMDRATQQPLPSLEEGMLLGEWQREAAAGALVAVKQMRSQATEHGPAVIPKRFLFDLACQDEESALSAASDHGTLVPAPCFQTSDRHCLLIPHYPDLLSQRLPLCISVKVLVAPTASDGQLDAQTILSTPHYGIGVLREAGTLFVVVWLRLSHDSIIVEASKQCKLLQQLLPWSSLTFDTEGVSAPHAADPHTTIAVRAAIRTDIWEDVAVYIDWEADALFLIVNDDVAAVRNLDLPRNAGQKRTASFPDTRIPAVIGADIAYNVISNNFVEDLQDNTPEGLLSTLARSRHQQRYRHPLLGLFEIVPKSLFSGQIADVQVRIASCLTPAFAAPPRLPVETTYADVSAAIEPQVPPPKRSDEQGDGGEPVNKMSSSAADEEMTPPAEHPAELQTIGPSPLVELVEQSTETDTAAPSPVLEEAQVIEAFSEIIDEDVWACTVCTVINGADDKKCSVCDAKRPNAKKKKPLPRTAPLKKQAQAKRKQPRQRAHAASPLHRPCWRTLVGQQFLSNTHCCVGSWPLTGEESLLTDWSSGGRTLLLATVGPADEVVPSRLPRVAYAARGSSSTPITPCMNDVFLPFSDSPEHIPGLLLVGSRGVGVAHTVFVRDAAPVAGGFYSRMELVLPSSGGLIFAVHAAEGAHVLTMEDVHQSAYNIKQLGSGNVPLDLDIPSSFSLSMKDDEIRLSKLTDISAVSEQEAKLSRVTLAYPRLPPVVPFAADGRRSGRKIVLDPLSIVPTGPPEKIITAGLLSHGAPKLTVALQDVKVKDGALRCKVVISIDGAAKSSQTRTLCSVVVTVPLGSSGTLRMEVSYRPSDVTLRLVFNGQVEVSCWLDLVHCLEMTSGLQPCMLSMSAHPGLSVVPINGLLAAAGDQCKLLRWTTISAHPSFQLDPSTNGLQALLATKLAPCSLCGHDEEIFRKKNNAAMSKGGAQTSSSQSANLIDTSSSGTGALANFFGDDEFEAGEADASTASQAVSQSQHLSGVIIIDGKAQCASCTYLNKLEADKCEICQAQLRRAQSRADKAFGGTIPEEFQADVELYGWKEAGALTAVGYVKPSKGYPSLANGRSGGSYVDASTWRFDDPSWEDSKYPGMPWYCTHCDKVLEETCLRCLSTDYIGPQGCTHKFPKSGVHDWPTCGILLCDLDHAKFNDLAKLGKITAKMHAAYKIAVWLRAKNGWYPSDTNRPDDPIIPAPPSEVAGTDPMIDSEMWTCKDCTYLNAGSRQRCEICDAWKPLGGLKGGQPHRTFSRPLHAATNRINPLLKRNRGMKGKINIKPTKFNVRLPSAAPPDGNSANSSTRLGSNALAEADARIVDRITAVCAIRPETNKLQTMCGAWSANIGPLAFHVFDDDHSGFILDGRVGYDYPLVSPMSLFSTTGSQSLDDPQKGSAVDCSSRRAKTTGLLDEDFDVRSSLQLYAFARPSHQAVDTVEQDASTVKDKSNFVRYKLPAVSEARKVWWIAGCAAKDEYAIAGLKQPMTLNGIESPTCVQLLQPVCSQTGSCAALVEPTDSLLKQFDIFRPGVSKHLTAKRRYAQTIIKPFTEDILCVGLTNMERNLVNICYQNALVQSLFMNTEMAKHLLESPLHDLAYRPMAPEFSEVDSTTPAMDYFLRSGWLFGLFPQDDKFGSSVEDLPLGLVAWKGNSVICDSAKARWGADATMQKDEKVAASMAITNRLQWLFARLALSVRRNVNSYALQAVLPSLFSNGKQQDVGEFLHTVADALDVASTQCKASATSEEQKVGLYEEIFGGETCAVRACVAPHADYQPSQTKEKFTQITLQFPSAFQPITGIVVLVGPKSAQGRFTSSLPPSYELLDTDLGSGKTGPLDPCVYIAVCRAPVACSFEIGGSSDTTAPELLQPITELAVLIERSFAPAPIRWANDDILVNPGSLDTGLVPRKDGWTVIPTNLNLTGSHAIYDRTYLAYRRGRGLAPFCDIMLTSADSAIPVPYQKFDQALNPGVTKNLTYMSTCRRKWIYDVKMSYYGVCDAFWETCGKELGIHDACVIANRIDPFAWQPFAHMHAKLLASYDFASPSEGRQVPVTEVKVVPAGADNAAHALVELSKSGYELATETDRPVCGFHVAFKRGEGCPISEIEVIRAPDYFNVSRDDEIIPLRPQVITKSKGRASPSLAAEFRGVWSGSLSHKLSSHQNITFNRALDSFAVVVNGKFGPPAEKKNTMLSGMVFPLNARQDPGMWIGTWAFVGSYRTPKSLQWCPASFCITVPPSTSGGPIGPGRVQLSGWCFDGGSSVTAVDTFKVNDGFRLQGRIIDIAVVTRREWDQLNALKLGWELTDLSLAKFVQKLTVTASKAPVVSPAVERLTTPLPTIAIKSGRLLSSIDVTAEQALYLCVRREQRIYRSSAEPICDHALGILSLGEERESVYTALNISAPCGRGAQAQLALPIVDVGFVSRSSAQKSKSWSELLPDDYIVIDTTPSGASAALGKADKHTLAGFYLVFRRAKVADTSESISVESLDPVSYSTVAAVLEVDVHCADQNGVDILNDGFSSVERSIGINKEKVNLSLTDGQTVTLAVKKGTVPASVLAGCPFTGLYDMPAIDSEIATGSGTSRHLELTALRQCPVALLGGVLGLDSLKRNQAATLAKDALLQTLQNSESPTSPSADVLTQLRLPRRTAGLDVEDGNILAVAANLDDVRDLYMVATPQHIVSRAATSMKDHLARTTDQSPLAGAYYMFGLWRPAPTYSAAAYSLSTDRAPLKPHPQRFELLVNGQSSSAIGTYSLSASESYLWELGAEHMAYLRIRKDVGTVFKEGKHFATNRVALHSVESLLATTMSAHRLARSNWLKCDTCGVNTEHELSSYVSSPPRHLSVLLARMAFNPLEGKAKKITKFVKIDRLLSLPVRRTNDAPSVLVPSTPSQVHYGLYAIVMHAGLSTDSGHYYAYCRPSEALSTASTANDDAALWIKFNDASVSAFDWSAVQKEMRERSSDTAYVLLYKRLDAANAEDSTPFDMSSYLGAVKWPAWAKRVVVDNVNLLGHHMGAAYSRLHADLHDIVHES